MYQYSSHSVRSTSHLDIDSVTHDTLLDNTKHLAIFNGTSSNHSGRLHTSTISNIRLTMSCCSRRHVAFLGMDGDAAFTLVLQRAHRIISGS